MKKITTFIFLTIIPTIFLIQIVFAQGVQVAPNQTSGGTKGTVSNISNGFASTSTQSGRLEVPLPFIGDSPSLASYISGLYRLAIYAAIIAAVIVITIAGINYATSGDNTSKQKEAREQIQDAIIGLVLILAAVLILRTINPALVTLSLPGINVQLGGKGVSINDAYNKCIAICDELSDRDQRIACYKACQQMYTQPDPQACYNNCCTITTQTGGNTMPRPVDLCKTDSKKAEECAIKCNKPTGDVVLP